MIFRSSVAGAVALTLASGAGVAEPHHDNGARHPAGVPAQFGSAFERFATEMNESMSTMMTDMHAPGYSGDPDVDFLAMMIAHHEGAIAMGRLALQYGDDPTTRKVAEEIVASQRVEIEGMRRRLTDMKSGASRANPGGYPALGGRGSDKIPKA